MTFTRRRSMRIFRWSMAKITTNILFWPSTLYQIVFGWLENKPFEYLLPPQPQFIQISPHFHFFQCSAKDFGVFRRVTNLAQEGRWVNFYLFLSLIRKCARQKCISKKCLSNISILFRWVFSVDVDEPLEAVSITVRNLSSDEKNLFRLSSSIRQIFDLSLSPPGEIEIPGPKHWSCHYWLSYLHWGSGWNHCINDDIWLWC